MPGTASRPMNDFSYLPQALASNASGSGTLITKQARSLNLPFSSRSQHLTRWSRPVENTQHPSVQIPSKTKTKTIPVFISSFLCIFYEHNCISTFLDSLERFRKSSLQWSYKIQTWKRRKALGKEHNTEASHCMQNIQENKNSGINGIHNSCCQSA